MQTRTSAAGSATLQGSQQRRLPVRSESTYRQPAPRQAALHSPLKSGNSASLTRGDVHCESYKRFSAVVESARGVWWAERTCQVNQTHTAERH